jgi:hypothetical protein
MKQFGHIVADKSECGLRANPVPPQKLLARARAGLEALRQF